MNITIVCVGKLKEKYLKSAVEEYSKRLTRYCKLNIIELNDEKTPENASQREEDEIKIKEGSRILSHIKDNSYAIALAINGNMNTSEEVAAYIYQLGVRGKSDITFVIGGSLGLSDDVLKRADYKLSFSRLTFPHQLFRVMLLEQIYRSFRINSGEPYHK